MADELKSANIDMWRESISTSIPAFFSVFSDIVTVFILIRFLTQKAVGLFFLCYVFLYLFSQLARGFGTAIRKKTSAVNSGQSEYLWCGFLLIIPTLLGGFLLFGLFQPVLQEYGSITIPMDVLVAFYLATFGFSVLEFARFYVAGCGKPALAEKLRTGIAKTSIPIITAIALTYNSSVDTALYAAFVAYLGTAILMFAYSKPSFIFPSRETITSVARFSKWSIVTCVLNDFYKRFDTILLSILVGTIAVSYYDSSMRLAYLSVTFAVGVSKTSNVKMSGLVETGQDISDIASKTIVAAPLLIFPMLMISLFNAEYLLAILFTPELKAASWYLILLVIVQLFQGYRLQFESIFNSYHKPRYNTYISLAAVLLNVVTAPFLVLKFGGLGVLYSTILAEILRLFLFELQLKQLLNDYLLPKAALIQYGIFILFCLFLKLLYMTFNLHSTARFATSVVVSTVLFYICLYYLSPEMQAIVQQYRTEKTVNL